MDRIGRLFHTVRYLRPRQLWARGVLTLRGAVERPEVVVRRAERHSGAWPGVRWNREAEFLPPAGGARQEAEALLSGRFSFVGREEASGFPPTDWDGAGGAAGGTAEDTPSASKLWLYNLHYFEWLWPLSYADARRAILDWIARHAPGGVGWEPYPTALRLMNWCAFLFGRHRDRTESDAELLEGVWPSVFAQAEWLAGHLEFHLMGNHLMEDAAALAFVGSCFQGEAAGRWKRLGLRLLRREIAEQVLPDGMHFERSPMYHARMTYLMLLLCQTGDADLGALAREPLTRMLGALEKVTHPDGGIALLNDAAFGIYNETAELRGEAEQLGGGAAGISEAAGAGAWSLPDAGYYGFRSDDVYIVCDAGPVGPDYIPGHAHGDIFSFELSLGGERVIVDSGVYDYAPGVMRDWSRSTAAHNTVGIEGEDQCEFWGAFRVARRGRPCDVRFEARPDGFRLEGWHDGYQRLRGRPRHERVFEFAGSVEKACTLSVRDRVRSARSVSCGVRLHLHPSVTIEKLQGRVAGLRLGAFGFAVTFDDAVQVDVEEGRYCPRFGVRDRSQTLVARACGANVETCFQIAVPKPARP